MPQPPPAPVLEAFRLNGHAEALSGGQGAAFRVGNVVLKRTTLPEETEWSAGVLAKIASAAVRVPHYVEAHTGGWCVDGWFAQTLLPGAHDFDRWPEVLDVADAFHVALRNVERPAFMARRSDPWAVADRMAWGEEEAIYADELAPLVAPLIERLMPVEADGQVIHGDFGGNVLFEDGLPPAVIDFSPDWRPAAFAKAVVVVDALAWHEADESLIDYVGSDENPGQLLLRAELRRLLELDQHLRQSGRGFSDQLKPHERVVAHLVSR